jgi:hypothetical protein
VQTEASKTGEHTTKTPHPSNKCPCGAEPRLRYGLVTERQKTNLRVCRVAEDAAVEQRAVDVGHLRFRLGEKEWDGDGRCDSMQKRTVTNQKRENKGTEGVVEKQRSERRGGRVMG